MSILAEPRRRQRLSVDPQNLTWKNNDQTKSRKLMEKMGWSSGDGLGKNRQGNVDSIKLKPNHTGKGLGADKLASYDSTWIGHHDDFADLLTALNKNKDQKPKNEEEKKERAQQLSIELNSKSIRRRIHYQKFTRAKDTTNYTDADKSAVMGIGLKRMKEEEQTEEKEEKKPDITEQLTGNTTVSTLSVADYFAAKMAALKAKKAGEIVEADVKVEVKKEAETHETDEEEERRRKKNEKKARKAARRAARQDVEMKMELKEEVVEEQDEETEKSKRRREKRERREIEQRLKDAEGFDLNKVKKEESEDSSEPKKKKRL